MREVKIMFTIELQDEVAEDLLLDMEEEYLNEMMDGILGDYGVEGESIKNEFVTVSNLVLEDKGDYNEALYF